MIFVRKTLRARRHRHASAPQARLQIEALESRTTPSDLSGNFWTDPEPIAAESVADGDCWDACAPYSDSQEAPFGDEIVVDTTALGDQYQSSVELDSSGAVAVWSDSGFGDTADLFTELYLVESDDGMGWSDEMLVAEAEMTVP